jgi:A/G-specific adenine glycosylase
LSEVYKVFLSYLCIIMNKLNFKLIEWYKIHHRNLPWRNTKNPYYIWLSEIILQQTRVDQGLPYYLTFIKTYPTVSDLASAHIDDVLRIWQGLGYYSRARNLHFTANQIITEYNGCFPNTYAEITKLKGIGDYTASAISSFAFNEVQPVLDGNVFRVISRFYGIEDDIAKNPSRKIFKSILEKEIDKKNPAVFNQAIMEFGALQCTPKNPDCSNCPIDIDCFALKNNLIGKLPVKSKNIKKRNRYFNFVILKWEESYALVKREGKDIWQGLFEFPLHESSTLEGIENLSTEYESLDIIKSKVFERNKKHLLSHQNIYSQMILFETSKMGDFDYYSLDEISKMGKPILIENFLQQYMYH